MNRALVLQELDPRMRVWLNGAHADTWDAIAREVAYRVALRVLVNEGEGGVVATVHELLLADRSPAVRRITAALGCGKQARRWTARQVSGAVRRYFDLNSYTRLERRVSKFDTAPRAKAA